MEVESGHLCLSSMLQKAGFYSTESLMRLSCRMCWLGKWRARKKSQTPFFCNVCLQCWKDVDYLLIA